MDTKRCRAVNLMSCKDGSDIKSYDESKIIVLKLLLIVFF